MTYVLGIGFIILALLLFVSVANNSWLNLWDALKSKETASADTQAPMPTPSGGPF